MTIYSNATYVQWLESISDPLGFFIYESILIRMGFNMEKEELVT